MRARPPTPRLTGSTRPREVFADSLLERGDPRGELISLQIARARGRGTAESAKRERAPLSEHAGAWMGPLEPAVQGNGFRFERGFLIACKLAWRKLLATPGLVTHPAWATVREYDLDPSGEQACDAWLDHMIALGAKRR